MLVVGVLALLGGCAAKGTGAFQVGAGGYDVAFESSKAVLRDYRFVLERVDAQQGVITTRDKASAGLASPWDTQQSTLGQELEEMLNQEYRVARVRFEEAAPDGLREGRVEVTVYRKHAPNLRMSSKSWRTAVIATDPLLTARGVYSTYSVPTERDSRLEARMARAIEREMGKAEIRSVSQRR
ncbi:hypothetical protein PHYC_01237 [Phycisphaerales bacterium]|nr:hypothetical protein PHYC_01237 [Phycisphaerales bacterium]